MRKYNWKDQDTITTSLGEIKIKNQVKYLGHKFHRNMSDELASILATCKSKVGRFQRNFHRIKTADWKRIHFLKVVV